MTDGAASVVPDSVQPQAFSSTVKKGVVIAQDKEAGRVLPANAKVGLILSRGRKR